MPADEVESTVEVIKIGGQTNFGACPSNRRVISVNGDTRFTIVPTPSGREEWTTWRDSTGQDRTVVELFFNPQAGDTEIYSATVTYENGRVTVLPRRSTIIAEAA